MDKGGGEVGKWLGRFCDADTDLNHTGEECVCVWTKMGFSAGGRMVRK